mgnify:FL=1
MAQENPQVRRSLDEVEKAYWNPGPSPLDAPLTPCTMLPAIPTCEDAPLTALSLDGEWELAPDGYTKDRVAGDWADAIPARVPGTVHTAMLEHGDIPDPMVGRNDKLARENSYRVWWMKRRFSAASLEGEPTLIFEGVCYRARFWLNGTYLGEHSGMFGGPTYPVGHLLREENTLVVRIENAPADPMAYSEYADHDEGWKNGVVINCVYGWHYACIPTRGIWDSVRLEGRPALCLERPFVAARNPQAGLADICLPVTGEGDAVFTGVIRPVNFEGESCAFRVEGAGGLLHTQVSIPDPHLWWPNGHGDPCLYELQVLMEAGGARQSRRVTFGLRTIEMAPLPEGPREDRHNWTFVFNGKPLFVKGVNWCTTDALLRCPRERTERFLTLAKEQHVQLLRAWGGGIPESDDFYDLCDRLGLMVMQEWPTCWDSDKQQPREELLETIRWNIPRLRSHPSLIQWAGGNESPQADGETMEAMARLCYELDGSRAFHRTSPWGGSIHNYNTYWAMQDIDATLQLKAPFMGEFGMASAPNLESVRRYLPREEWDEWDVTAKNSFNYHTPRFNEWPGDPDMNHLLKRVPEFYDADTMAHFIIATQLAQATCIRHTLESFRARWPESTGICYYKLTDVYPACSWSTVDYYGVPKRSYYVLADSYAPLHACVTTESTTLTPGGALPVFLLNDTAERGDYCVTIAAYDAALRPVLRKSFETDGVAAVIRLGDFAPDAGEGPLFITAEVRQEGALRDRTFYWFNYKDQSGCLFDRPRTALRVAVKEGALTVRNDGTLPAVGVTVECPEHDTVFTAEDSLFWLEPGENRTLAVSHTEGLRVSAWNADTVNT